MHSFRTSLLPALSLALQAVELVAASPACDCYKTSTGDVFTSHQFLDFRNGKPANFDSFFSILAVDNYKGNTVNNEMTAANVGFNKGAMSLLTTNDGSGTQKSADMYSKPSMLHGSFRMHAQITGAAGRVAGFFTYLDAYNEQDIEILTNEAPNQIHYTTHDNGGVAGGDGNPTLNTTIGSSSWKEYTTYRFDWTSATASFYTNNDPQAKTLNTAIPTKPCTLNLNMWSSGDQWGGAMAPGQSATMNVQWIEAVYDAANAAPAGAAKSRVRRYAAHHEDVGLEARQAGGSCNTVCKVDGVSVVGTPEVV